MLINLEKHPEIIKKNAERCKERGLTLPTFKEMKNPSLIPESVKENLKKAGLFFVSVGNVSITISPFVLRTAIADVLGPRIIIPSISA